MPDICILCENPTRTGEHLFPAAMGGRRENQGIYCGDHNAGFSDLVKLLTDQVAALNARLSVLHDRGHKPQKYPFVDASTGMAYTIFGGNITPAMPGPVATKAEDESPPTYRFANEAQFQQWLKRERQKPGKVVLGGRGETGQSYLTQRPSLPSEFGGIEGIRAIAYLALTHFAHYFPSEARQTGLAPFKTYVLGGANTRFACWDSFPSAVKESAQFDFSHWIIVGVSKTTQTAYARLSLFSVADFSMHLGSVDVSADKEVIVEIDPTAPHPPNDMRYEQRDFSHERPSYPTDPEETHRARVTAQCLDALGQLLAKIERQELDQLLDELHPVLVASAALDQSERLACIQKIVTNQAQRILMLLKYAAAGLAKQFETSYLADVVRDEIDSFIQSDATTPSGLSGKTERLLALALDRFAKDLLDRVESGGLDRASLESLLNGGLGAAVVGPVLMPCLQEAVVGHMSRLHGRGSS